MFESIPSLTANKIFFNQAMELTLFIEILPSLESKVSIASSSLFLSFPHPNFAVKVIRIADGLYRETGSLFFLR